MKTITQPIDFLDKPNAKPLVIVKGGAGTVWSFTSLWQKDRGGVDHINLSIAAGQKVRFVGQSGACKPTLVKLILWFYDVEKRRDHY